jgi:hypothetical protein
MSEFSSFGKMLVVIGLITLGVGVFIWLGGKIPGIGRLPGDIVIKRENFTFYFPLATSIIVSVILTVILSLLGRR